MSSVRKHINLVVAIAGILLLSIGLVVDTMQTLSPNIHRAKHIIERNLHKEEHIAEKIISTKKVLQTTNDFQKLKDYFEHNYKDKSILFYVYKDGVLQFWSSNAFVPENISKLSEQDILFLKENNGFYEVFSKTSSDNRISVFALIPIYYQFETENKFLVNGFVWSNFFLKRFIISNKISKTSTYIENSKGKNLFSIRVADNADTVSNPYTIFLEIIGLLLIFWSMYQVVKKLLISKKYILATSSILFVVLLVDVIVNQLKLLAITKNSLLFSSNLYASSGFSDTLGTLFIRVFDVDVVIIAFHLY